MGKLPTGIERIYRFKGECGCSKSLVVIVNYISTRQTNYGLMGSKHKVEAPNSLKKACNLLRSPQLCRQEMSSKAHAHAQDHGQALCLWTVFCAKAKLPSVGGHFA